jgi:hypothetical protein
LEKQLPYQSKIASGKSALAMTNEKNPHQELPDAGLCVRLLGGET